jgi:hypothetical protein
MNVRRQCTARFQNVARVCAMNVAVFVFVFLLFFREEVRELTASRSGGRSRAEAFSRVFVASCFFSVGSFSNPIRQVGDVQKRVLERRAPHAAFEHAYGFAV